jgi:hypothetical protein
MERTLGEGFLLQKQDFPVNVKTSIVLFETLCQIAIAANPHMAGQVRIIKGSSTKRMIEKLLKEGIRNKFED